jgi:Mannitol repressor
MSISSELRKLRLRRPTLLQIEEVNRLVEIEENDRGAAILAATLIDTTLAYAIKKRMPGGATYGRLFESGGPLSTIDAKILVAYGLDIFKADTYHDLDILRHVRNTFAHAPSPVSFKTPEIANACMTLRSSSLRTARQKFTATCYLISIALVEYGAACERITAGSLDPSEFVAVTPEPLQ